MVFDDEDDWDADVPSLDDIIPWSGEPRKPRHPQVFDPIFGDDDKLNPTFLEKALKSYLTKDGVAPPVKLESFTEATMQTQDPSQKSIFTEVTLNAIVKETPQTYNLVVKTVSVAETLGALSAVLGFDRREVGLYIEILDDINVFQQQEAKSPDDFIKVPSTECYFARYTEIKEQPLTLPADAPKNESVIIMENVKLQGFTHPLLSQGLSKEQVLTAFEGIARLHGLSLAMKERSGIPLKMSYPYLLCMREASHFILELFDRNMPHILGLLGQFGATDLRKKLLKLRPVIQDLILALSRPEEPVSVLAHMNLWAHNILFKGDECVFIDWQMITCSRPTFDLAFLLASSVKANVRRRYRKLFLDHYYQSFTTYALRYGLNIKKDLDYTKKHLEKDFHESQLLALLFYIAKSTDLIKTRDTQLQFVDYIYDIDEQDLLIPNIMKYESPEYLYWLPRNPTKANIIFRLEDDDSSSEEEEEQKKKKVAPAKDLYDDAPSPFEYSDDD